MFYNYHLVQAPGSDGESSKSDIDFRPAPRVLSEVTPQTSLLRVSMLKHSVFYSIQD